MKWAMVLLPVSGAPSMKTQPGEAAISSETRGHVSGMRDSDIGEILTKKLEEDTL
jgi:hypothetical protein